ncbi:WecB/TagA/CpsF family glycosyltransferase [Clostridiales bacterium BX7]|uniref:N-acetylglucosaminyldiphosphoundecaprenol N-acetyl-beta-D-mannosaminyltransferase n=2 Tax=Feifania hominis TaxID=2763660 RepID=A0A926DCC4_9FIRM|nr:WecB/TagA/CpsF family glycosyltransferase [Feifania hominis]MBC8535242.1 WecB/TagA/CpsF family glycosyltransferase [Feifania hominis]
MRMDKLAVGGLNFDNVTMEQALERALELIEAHAHSYIVTPNAEIGQMALKDPAFRRVLNGAALMLPDGIGVVLGSKILGTPLKGKVAGCDFAERLVPLLAERGHSLFLFGSKEGVAQAAAQNLKESSPNLHICGTQNGYFQDDGEIVDAINAAHPDVLFVCLGAPKQEYWMARNAERLDVGLMIGLGGSLDVMAGTVERAPEFYQRHHLEWLYRAVKEPKRLRRLGKLPAYVCNMLLIRLRLKRVKTEDSK